MSLVLAPSLPCSLCLQGNARFSVLDQRDTVDDQVLVQNIKILNEAVIRYIYDIKNVSFKILICVAYLPTKQEMTLLYKEIGMCQSLTNYYTDRMEWRQHDWLCMSV